MISRPVLWTFVGLLLLFVASPLAPTAVAECECPYVTTCSNLEHGWYHYCEGAYCVGAYWYGHNLEERHCTPV